MATYYVDYEGGNDASAGTSFATRWQTLTSGATAARIAPGDEIRVMASPDPTSMGNATWTGGGRPAAAAITSSTNATPIVITTTAAHGLVAGDYVTITGHTTNTNANGVWRVGTTASGTEFQILQMDGTNTTGNGVGASGTFTKANNLVVKTASALVQNIALCGGLGQKPAWTASANVTATQETTNYKEGGAAAAIAIAAGFTTGKAAYYTLPSTLNLSSYQQVSFWIRQSTGTLGAAGAVYVALCTDTIGNTVAHTCNVPALGALNVWLPVTVNLGTNLNSAIQSVALYVVTDNAAQTFQLDNIIAGKAASSADSVTLTSLISKSDGTGDEAWYAIQSINSDVIMLSNRSDTVQPVSNNIMGYNGASGTVTTYKRETIKTTPQATADSTGVSVINDSGTAGNVITFSGGWNRTDMSTQTGVTWLDGQNGIGRGVNADVISFISIDRINVCRYSRGLYLVSATDASVGSIYATACSTGGIDLGTASRAVSITNCWVNNNTTGINTAALGGIITNVKSADNNTSYGVSLNASRYCFINSVIAGNSGLAASSGASLRFNNALNCIVGTATISNSRLAGSIISTASINCAVNGGSSSGSAQGVNIGSTLAVSELYLNNFTINEATEVAAVSLWGGFVYSNRHDNTDNNSWIFQPGMGTINQQTSVIDSPATTAWQMRPTAVEAAAASPLMLKLGTVVCAASSLVTVTARMRRTNTGLTMRLVCPGGQISGVATDVITSMTAAADTWQTVTITFTPTKAGAVDIYAHAFGGTTFSGYVSNLTAAQA